MQTPPLTATAQTKQHVRVFFIVVVVLVGIVVVMLFHPYLIGLPGRFDETRFARGLHAGLSRQQVQNLIADTHGSIDPAAANMAEAERENCRSRPASCTLNVNHALPVSYVEFATLCAASGQVFLLQFDHSNHLESWQTLDWTDGC